MNNISQIFTYTDADLSLSEADEVAMIEAAKAGNEEATMTLVRAYGPVLRSTVRRFGKGTTDADHGNAELDLDDLQSAALVAFLEVIESHDPEKCARLAGRVKFHLANRLADEFAAVASFFVPERMLSRYYGIMKKAEDDAVLGESLAPEFGMSVEAFRDVHAAVRGTGSIDQIVEEANESGVPTAFSPVRTPSPIADVEDRILVDLAFAAVDDEEARIVNLAYGFTPVTEEIDGARAIVDRIPSDEEIAQIVGSTRPTVQRKRKKAVEVKMRKALGVSHA